MRLDDNTGNTTVKVNVHRDLKPTQLKKRKKKKGFKIPHLKGGVLCIYKASHMPHFWQDRYLFKFLQLSKFSVCSLLSFKPNGSLNLAM